ncbi:MAG: DUF1761 domain-containing protein [Pseudomonadota bacterium]
MDFSSSIAAFNVWAVLGAGVTSFVIGGIWYGPVFGQVWITAFGFTEEDLASRPVGRTFGLSLLLALIAAANLELFIGAQADWVFGATAGFFAGFGWVAMFLGILYLFEMRKLAAYLIDAGYCVICLTVMGVLLGAF